MLYKKPVSVDGENHTERVNILCERNAEFLMLMITVPILTTKLDVWVTGVFCWMVIVELYILKYIKIRYLKCRIDYQM